MNNMSTGDNVQEPAAASRYSPSSHSVADKVVSASDDALCEEFAAVKPKNQPGPAPPGHIYFVIGGQPSTITESETKRQFVEVYISPDSNHVLVVLKISVFSADTLCFDVVCWSQP